MQSTRINIHSMQKNLRRRLFRVEGSSPYDKALVSQSDEQSEDSDTRIAFLEKRVKELESQLSFYTGSKTISNSLQGKDIVPDSEASDYLSSIHDKYYFEVQAADLHKLKTKYSDESLWRSLSIAEARILADCLINRFQSAGVDIEALWAKFI